MLSIHVYFRYISDISGLQLSMPPEVVIRVFSTKNQVPNLPSVEKQKAKRIMQWKGVNTQQA